MFFSYVIIYKSTELKGMFGKPKKLGMMIRAILAFTLSLVTNG